MQLDAGRDLVIASAQEHDLTTRKDRKGNSRREQITQYGSDVEAGGNIELSAERDLAVIASRVSAEKDLLLAAGGDVLIAAAANESHYESHRKSGGKKVDIVDSQVRQQAAELTAGGNLTVLAGNDLTAVASKLKAGDEAYLYAGNQLSLLAAQNSDYSLYDMSKKGGWGSKATQRDEVTTIRNVGTSITAGGDLTLVSEGDQLYQRARLESGNNLTLDSGGSITFEAVKDLDQESHEKSDDNAFWTSMEGKGTTDETLRQSVLLAQGEVVIKAVDGLKIDIKQIDQKTVSQTIDAMVQAEPELAWLKQAEARGDVDWRQVKEIHDSFKYEHSGLGPASQLIIAIALSAIMGPMMAGMNAMVQAGAVSVATKATVSTINNRGNLGAVAKDITSSDSIKGYVAAVATAGVGEQFGYNPTNFSAKDVAIKVTADAVVKTAVYGGSFKDNLTEAALGNAVSIGGALGANEIGNLPLADGSLSKIVLHAALGGLMAEAMGGDFRTGALAAGANEALVSFLGDKLLPEGMDKNSPEYIQATKNLLAASQIVGVLASVVADGDVNIGAAVAANATANNFLLHSEVQQMLAEREACATEACRLDVQAKYAELDDLRNRELSELCDVNKSACTAIYTQLELERPKIALLAQQLRQNGADAGVLYMVESHIPESNLAAQMSVINTEVAKEKGGLYTLGALIAEGIAGLSQWGRPTASVGGKTISQDSEASGTSAGKVSAELPTGYRELKASAGAMANTTGGLPEGHRRVVSSTGNVEVLAPNGKLYVETSSGLLPKSGAFSFYVEREKAIQAQVTGPKGGVVEPIVTAKGTVKGTVFEDVNQTAKIGPTNEPTLIAERVAAKTEAEGKPHPNGTVADSHAEIGVIQQAYNAGKTQGSVMSMTVSGKDVCGYCKGDIAAAAHAAGLKSLTVQAVDNVTGLPKTYYWQPGMKSIKEKQ